VQVRDRIKEFRRIPSRLIRPSPKNWRTHPQQQQDVLKGILAEVGVAAAVLVREVGGGFYELIDGHLRVETLPPDQEVPALVLDVTEQEAAKLLATFDPIGDLAGADPKLLAELLEQADLQSPALLQLADELAASHLPAADKPAPGGGGDDFDPAPAAGPTRCQAGEVWELGGKHRLLVGDCTLPLNVARLMAGRKADLMFTDPPYGVDYVGRTKKRKAIANDGAEGLPELLKGAFAGALEACRRGACWYVCAPSGPQHWDFAKALLDIGVYRAGLVWKKDRLVMGHGDYHYIHEPIFYGWVPGAARKETPDRTQTSVWEVARPHRSDDHPTMKPVELPARAIRNSSEPGWLVYDPFLGSGTTLIAAHREGRTCYGMELECQYAEVILKRGEAEGMVVRRVD